MRDCSSVRPAGRSRRPPRPTRSCSPGAARQRRDPPGRAGVSRCHRGPGAATLSCRRTAKGPPPRVLRLDSDRLASREVTMAGAVRPAGLAAAGPERAWLLGTAGDRVVPLHREPPAGGEDARWVPIAPGRGSLLFRQALPAGVTVRRRRRAAGRSAHGDARRPVAGPPRHACRWLAPVDVTEHLAVPPRPTRQPPRRRRRRSRRPRRPPRPRRPRPVADSHTHGLADPHTLAVADRRPRPRLP